MQVGDWFLTIDTLERLSPDFTGRLKNICTYLDYSGIDGAYLHNKRLLFKFNEQTAFANNPHEGIIGVTKTIELSKQPFWEEHFQKNIRSEKRQDPLYFINHNFKYYFFPNTNHLLLGFEDDKSLVNKRYQNRSKLIELLKKQGLNPLCLKSIEECFRFRLDDEIKKCINFDKFLNDWYRLNILEQKEGFVDKHDFNCFEQIKF
tara:strand:- start:322 stop:933 length:612 start_codon:yes stop_codon:yes gene_type:complete